MRRLLVLFLGITASAAAQTAVPPGELLLTGQGFDQFGLTTFPGSADAVSIRTVDADGPGFKQALRVETLRNVNPPFAIQLRATSPQTITKGDSGLIRFYARTIETADESGTGRIGINLRHPVFFGPGSLSDSFNPPHEWTEYLVPVRFAQDYSPQQAVLSFDFGFMKQTVEIGGIEAYYYGTKVAYASLPRTRFTYKGREPDAAWRKEALARIDKIRKADVVVRVVDKSGHPVPDAVVHLTETRSAFQWGTAIPFARLLNDSPDNQIYRQHVLELFNAASPENDLKWPAWIGEMRGGGTYSSAQALAGLRWLREHHFTVRGHVMVWPGWRNLPKMISDLKGTPRQNEIPGLVREHITEIGKATRDLVSEWDVLNEPFTNHDLMDVFGRDIMIDWFKTARAAMPNARLFLNDFSNQDATTDGRHVKYFEDTARFLLDGGAPLTGLGMQAHIGGQPSAPENVLAVLDRYQKDFNLPIRITEFDVRTNDEELQADYTRDFFILAFSHPSVIGIQLWGFWENAHWIPNAAMYRSDWSEKPNAAVYKSLVLDQWRTHANGTTTADGRYATRGFLGDYTVTVESKGSRAEKTFTLAKSASPAATTVEVALP